jgi:hypothetical protein
VHNYQARSPVSRYPWDPESAMTAFKRSQAKYVKRAYRNANWPEYEAGLRQRGNLTVWISRDELGGWRPPERRQRKPGGQQRYSNQAIETALTVGMVFHLALRQTEGFLGSLFSLLGVDCRAADHTTISRRVRKLGKLPLCSSAGNKPVHILVDSTGLKLHVGNLRKPPRNRDWRKLHVSVNALTGEAIACDLTSKSARDASRVPALLKQIDCPLASVTADGAYDKEAVYEAVENHTATRSPRVLIPPKRNAQLRPEVGVWRERNRNIRSRARLGARRWHTKSGYSRRSLVENTIYRYKTIIGPAMRSRTLQGQRVEARVGCRILNTMAALGMPESHRVD